MQGTINTTYFADKIPTILIKVVVVEAKDGELMNPTSEDVLTERPVSKAVGNVKNNGPELLAVV